MYKKYIFLSTQPATQTNHSFQPTNIKSDHPSTVVPNLFWPKIYFSSSQPPEIYQSIVDIANPHTHRFQPAVTNLTTLFLVVTQLLDITSQNPPSLKHTHTWQSAWWAIAITSSVAPPHPHSLTSPCSSIAGGLHFFKGLHDLCFIFKSRQKGYPLPRERLLSQYHRLWMASCVQILHFCGA